MANRTKLSKNYSNNSRSSSNNNRPHTNRGQNNRTRRVVIAERDDNDRLEMDESMLDMSNDDSYWVYITTRFFIPSVCFVIAFAIGYQGYLETRINTPFDSIKVVQKSGLYVPDRYWGSYRPNVYFGMKTREPYSLVTGIMWFYPEYLSSLDTIRHWCEQNDYLKGYSWIQHDGRNFGAQVINDQDVQITTTFVKKLRGSYGGDWSARISFDGVKSAGRHVSLLLYTAIENQTVGSINPITKDLINGVLGYTSNLGDFTIRVTNTSGNMLYESTFSHTHCEGLDVIKEVASEHLRVSKTYNDEIRFLLLRNTSVHSGEKNLIITHAAFAVPFSVDIFFESASTTRTESISGKVFDTEYEKHKNVFNEKFENVFHLKKRGFNESEIEFAKAAFSNLIGGIGYFYGSSRVLSEHTDSPVPYWKAPLYTAVPSRSFFPRGFLWDEGFHGFLLAVWDLDIQLDIMSHWFDLMNVQGWIPREQILGAEALRKVPPEFVTQINTNANPPVYFLTLQFIIQNFEEQLIEQSSRLETLDRLYTRLVAWFDWFNTTQVGVLPSTYRWRGRDSNATRELNPKTLTSGMDDYPRASHPTESERHVDLRCWMAVSASTLVTISNLLNKPSKRFAETAAYLTDNGLLNHYHWSDVGNTYADFGLHTDNVILKSNVRSKQRTVLKPPELRLVDTIFGYNSLFPLMLQILDANSPKLGIILKKLRDPELLWTNYGLRSLAKSSPLYMAYNTEHDPPYWRGPIWINMNYLVIRSLNYYAKIDGPYGTYARQLFEELRHNVISNVYKEYIRTGYLWEHYNDVTGIGEGCRPFNGWTTLVVLLMADLY